MFDLPQHLGEFSIPIEAPFSLDFEVQYKTADGEVVETEEVETRAVVENEFTALEAHRAILRERAES